jgi:ribosomal protein L11 methyltransferase
MQRRELQLLLQAHRVAAAEALLELAGAEAISLTDAGDDALLEPAPGQTPLWRMVRLSALFHPDTDLTPVVRTLRESFPDLPGPGQRTLGDSELAPAPEPVQVRHFGERLTLAAADQPLPVDTRSALVRLNMGLAFGTGAHPTTALCLEWLASRMEPGIEVIDYGCGSGVLALAALALGADRVWAVDNEPQALTATRANARLNGREQALWTGTPEAFREACEAGRVHADLIVANILCGPLITLAPAFAAWLKPGGRVVLSGVLPSQLHSLEQAYQPLFTIIGSTNRDEWALFEAQFPP